MTSTIKVHEEKVPVDPVLLFQRMSITAAFQDEIENYFEYELSPYPLSLFDDIGIRKTQKSAIYDCFEKVDFDINNTNATNTSLTEDTYYIALYGIVKKHSTLY
ncbi:unnamed protein product [Pieris macdunnoughi]|uniref:Uncharacterized protein n=1 Tax=Pieris macdunnoughi TaxID=345717 RepID=A0A821UIW4_9NEOP|nr:unnamed protein product [Pieris macdunnoughi]